MAGLKDMELDRRVSLGNIIVLAGMIVSMSIAWANLSSRTETLAEDFQNFRALSSSNEARIRTLEQQVARQDERHSAILSYLSRIEALIERIETRAQQTQGPNTPSDYQTEGGGR